jgi:Flp pilus assembly protein TadG
VPTRQITRSKRQRRGSATIEFFFALIALLWVAMGTIEFGQYLYIKHTFQAAARDAARSAIPSTAALGDPVAAATRTLNLSNITFNSAWMSITDLTTSTAVTDVSAVTRGHTLRITLSTSYSSIPSAVRPLNSITGGRWGIGNGKPIIGQCAMVKE